MKGFIIIPDEFLEIDLTMTELICLSVIWGFSQNEQGCYFGSQTYLAERCKCSRQHIIRTLKHLEELDLIIKTQGEAGQKNTYRVNYATLEVCENVTGGCNKMLQGGVTKCYTNNNIDNNINTLSNNRERGVTFKKPTPQDVEVYCNEQGLTIDPQAFCDYYESKGWKVGSSPMKDWKAACRNWARRERKGRGATESVFEHNLRVMRELQIE